MKVFNQGMWFRLTRRRWRTIALTLAVAAFVSASFYTFARAFQVVESHRARMFIEELKRIQPGQAAESVIPFILKYGGAAGTETLGAKDDAYLMRIDPWHMFHVLPGPQWMVRGFGEVMSRTANLRRKLGLRIWSVSGGIKLKSEKVEAIYCDLLAEGENEWLMADWHLGTDIPAQSVGPAQPNPVPSRQPSYIARWTHLHLGYETGEGMRIWVTPSSTPEQLRAARDINLQCLTIGRGCRSLCELLPEANRYRHEHNDGGWGWNSGSWGIQPHDCD